MDLFTLSASLGLDITNFEGGINIARRLLLQFAGAVVDFGQDVVETGMGFDKQMSAVQAVMGLTENTAENLATMNELRKFALEQARDSIFTSEEAATAYYYMGMAGWRAEQMVAGLPGVMALAAASGEDLKMTSDMVTDSLTAFGLGAGQAAHFADVLAVTATNANTDVSRMQQTFKNLAPIAGALGYSIEDVALSVGLIANSGVKGSQAGTALRNIFTRIATNAGATSKDLGALQIVTDKLGVSFYTAEGRARPWGEVLADIRIAWNKLDPDKIDKVTAAFGEFSASSQSADEIMAEFASDLDAWTTEWNSLTTAVEREQFVAQLEPQFAALGISMRDSNGQLREFSEVAKDARVKLGGLTDQEQIYYGKQIGSLRGIAGWLALVTASEADVRQLTNAIKDADGAAQAMADTRLDNLWGDVTHFMSVLDTLKIAIYDDVKGPMRDVVQWATDAINEITDAINENGLAGGIEVLGDKIEEAGEKFAPLLESIGKAAGPLVNALFDNVLPRLTEAGAKLGAGLLQGLGNSMAENSSSIGGMAGLFLSTLGSGVKIIETVSGWLKNAGELGGKSCAEAWQESMIGIPQYEIDEISAKAAEWGKAWGTSSGDTMSSNMGTEIGADAPAMRDDLATVLGAAGTPAGQTIASAIGTELSSHTYSINVQANVSGLPAHHNASAMTAGRIFTRATVFGFANGQYQVAGDAGPEAVIGTNSLAQLIQSAVRGAMGGQQYTTPMQGGAPRNIVIPLYIDGREFARAEVPFIDAEYQRVGLSLVTR